MSRQKQLHKLARKAEKVLTQWALEENVLSVGQKIVFTLRIEKMEIVAGEVHDAVSPTMWQLITSRQIYDAAIRYSRKHNGRFSRAGTVVELGNPRGVQDKFSMSTHPFRIAYWAAKNGHDFPEELEKDDIDHHTLYDLVHKVGG